MRASIITLYVSPSEPDSVSSICKHWPYIVLGYHLRSRYPYLTFFRLKVDTHLSITPATNLSSSTCHSSFTRCSHSPSYSCSIYISMYNVRLSVSRPVSCPIMSLRLSSGLLQVDALAVTTWGQRTSPEFAPPRLVVL